MRLRVVERVANGGGEPAMDVAAEVVTREQAAERQRLVRLLLPEIAEVGDLREAVLGEGEASFVDEDAELRRAVIEAMAGEITVSVNCGQEMYDVIEVTDTISGLSTAKRRVVGIDLHYTTGKRPAYDHRIRLGNP